MHTSPYYESFVHAGAVNECKVRVVPIHAEDLEGSYKDVGKTLKDLNGILVAPGFGERGIEGKLSAIRFARENDIPFFGICLGMQTACVEFARNVLSLADASSTEVNPGTPHPVIDMMSEQKKITKKGGTMRLGAYPCEVKKKTKAHAAYGSVFINERHRHRWEFNNAYLDQFEKAGMTATGINPESNLVEIMELKSHKWFVGVQFHPELKSTVENPHPLFVAFVKACMG
jgi:CTP synthase